jgi:lipoyl-dependent peroxiredoxin
LVGLLCECDEDCGGKMKVTLPPDLDIDAEVDVGTTREAYGLAARLNVSLPGMEHQVAQRLVEATDRLCPYSNATRGYINVAIKLV